METKKLGSRFLFLLFKGTIVNGNSIAFNEMSDQVINYLKKYFYDSEKKHRRTEKIEKKSQFTTEIAACPACHAPVKKEPPCECEYCGYLIRKRD